MVRASRSMKQGFWGLEMDGCGLLGVVGWGKGGYTYIHSFCAHNHLGSRAGCKGRFDNVSPSMRFGIKMITEFVPSESLFKFGV